MSRNLSKASPVQKKENNTGLPDNLKSGVENLSGYSLDNVPGQERHLPHEAWHVAQQKQGRVQPTMQLKGKLNISDDAGLENEADHFGSVAAGVGS
ncbi:hypothetical protein [Pedobacter nyackensis]|uniref:DUF4157 domain-containing protein n=1 Tax=Pedobacter nyackensis TaxID=475255 RepID=A0A1W2EXY1_9SPHI|nr:hypothetical protein [Pedobacter nyackensis]SMD14510.1 hypothetical protein SAMN04488101_117101 [Pedobacter nyackensis]